MKKGLSAASRGAARVRKSSSLGLGTSIQISLRGQRPDGVLGALNFHTQLSSKFSRSYGRNGSSINDLQVSGLHLEPNGGISDLDGRTSNRDIGLKRS